MQHFGQFLQLIDVCIFVQHQVITIPNLYIITSLNPAGKLCIAPRRPFGGRGSSITPNTFKVILRMWLYDLMDFDLVDLMPCNLRSDLIDGDLIAEMGLYHTGHPQNIYKLQPERIAKVETNPRCWT